MALITFAGFPASGKSSRAQQLADYLNAKLTDNPQFTVKTLSDHSLGLTRAVYDGMYLTPRNSRSEKPARGTLFTAIQRHLSSDTILIVDSLNYIKGFRYQIYCAAREMKLRTCTVFVVAPPDKCRQWNDARQADSRYKETTLENLLVRFEEPSSMVRWDAPLFTVMYDDAQLPGEDIWEAITKGNLKPPNSGTLAVAKAPADALHILEQTTTLMASAIVAASNACTGGETPIAVGANVKVVVTLPPRNITLSEMQRLKRQFVTVHKKAITLGTTERGSVDWSEESVTQKFSVSSSDVFVLWPPPTPPPLSVMPLPTDQTLSILPYSRPGDATQSRPKTAMLVRMSAETLAALESQPAQTQIHFEFGDKPGIYVGDTYFPMKHSSEESDASPHELFLRAASANKKAAPLKLFATVVGKFQVERELTKELREKISGSTQDAVKQRNSRNIVFIDTPPDIPLNPKKRKDPAAATMFRKPVKPADIKGPSAAATPIAVTKVPPPSVPSSSSKEPGVPLRTRVIRCLAASPKPEEELLKLICGSGASQAQRRDVFDLLQLVAELDSNKKPPHYRLKTQSWLEVRPYEWNMPNPERIQMLRNTRGALQNLGLKDGDPAWEHVRDRSPVSSIPASSSTTSPEQSRPSTSTSSINGKNLEVQPKRGLSSREVKEKAKRPKADPKAEITAKDESLRATRPTIPAPEVISRSESARSNLAPERRTDVSRMNPPEPRRAEPTRSNEFPRAAEPSAARKPPAPPEPRPTAPKVNNRPAPSPAASTSRKRERDDDREVAEPAAVSRGSSTTYNEDKSLASQRIKRIKRESGINSDNDKERDRDRDRDRERVASPADRVKAKAKREESPRDDRLDRAKTQDRPMKRDDSPRDERVERLRTQERPLKREESPRDDKAERLKAKERSIKREESPRDEKNERLKARERTLKREESPGGERMERTKLKEKAMKREESPRGDMRASTSKRKMVDHGDDDVEDDYRDGKVASQVKKRKTEQIPSTTSSRAREREREQEQNERDGEHERDRERERKERQRERDRRERERDREKEREREQRIREREREERRKDGSPLKQSHVEPRSSKGTSLASSSRSKPSKREESPPPVKKKTPATVSAASPDSHSTYSNDHQRSKSTSAKPRRRSPIYTSSEEEDEALARRGTRNGISQSISSRETASRKLPTDRSSLRKHYDACYDEYTETYSQLIKQRHILRKLHDSDALPDGDSDSEGDSGLMDVDKLEALTKKYHKLCNELKSIRDILQRPLKNGELLSGPEIFKA